MGGGGSAQRKTTPNGSRSKLRARPLPETRTSRSLLYPGAQCLPPHILERAPPQIVPRAQGGGRCQQRPPRVTQQCRGDPGQCFPILSRGN